MIKQEKVLITEIESAAGSAAVEYFRDHKYYVIGMDGNENVTVAVDEFRKAYPVNSQFYLDQLLLLSETNNVSLILPTGIKELVEISFYKQRFYRKGINVYISSAFPIKICSDIYYISKMLKKNGLVLPNYYSFYEYRNGSVNSTNLADYSHSKKKGQYKYYVLAKKFAEEFEQENSMGHFKCDITYNINLCIDSEEPHQILAGHVLEICSQSTTNEEKNPKTKRVNEQEIMKLGVKAGLLLNLIGSVNITMRKNSDGTLILLNVDPKLGDFCGATPEILDALVWMWQRDTGKKTKYFVSTSAQNLG